jgi:hypothetical protein
MIPSPRFVVGCWLAVAFGIAAPARAQNVFGTGCLYDSVRYEKVPLTAPLVRGNYQLPEKASLKAYCPTPGDQGATGMCTAWSVAYASRTTLLAQRKRIDDKAQINAMAFSPSFIYNQIRLTADCSYGAYISDALHVMKTQGTALLADFALDCNREVTPTDKLKAKPFAIQDYKRLFSRMTDDTGLLLPIKKSLSEGKPVVVSIRCFSSLETAKGVWNKQENDLSKGYHAVTLIGYDDNMHGGAFEIMNSWSPRWGNDGFIWMRYSDFEKNCMEAYEIADFPADPLPQQPAFGGEIALKKADGSTMPAVLDKGVYRTKDGYYSGTAFQFFISHQESVYLYALATDDGRKFKTIFPYNNLSPLMSYKRGTIAFPGEDLYLQLDSRPGSDFLCVLYSRTPLDIEALRQRLEFLPGTLAQKLQTALGSTAVQAANVSYKANTIGFQTKPGLLDKGAVVPLILEIKHK